MSILTLFWNLFRERAGYNGLAVFLSFHACAFLAVAVAVLIFNAGAEEWVVFIILCAVWIVVLAWYQHFFFQVPAKTGLVVALLLVLVNSLLDFLLPDPASLLSGILMNASTALALGFVMIFIESFVRLSNFRWLQ